MTNTIPVSEPLFCQSEEEYVLDCIRTGWVSSEGKYVKKFERSCADYCSREYGVAVSSGTAALQVAMRCLHLDEGDEVIMPSFTMISCAIAIIEAGAMPVLVDCDPETWIMRVQDVENKITSKTKAIMAVHIYGHPVDMDIIFDLSEKYGLSVIEDAAEAHGAEYKGQKCGGLGDISILSFYANKLVTTGEGGMILTNNHEYAEKARSLRNMCFLPEERFLHKELGHNYRLSNIQAAIGVAQLERLEQFVSRKREMAQMYNDRLKGLPLNLPVEKLWAKNIYWMYAVVLDDLVNIGAKEFAKLLLKKGVETRPFFRGMHEQPVFHKMGLFKDEKYPITEKIYRRGFYLPSGQAITDYQIESVCNAMYNVFNELEG